MYKFPGLAVLSLLAVHVLAAEVSAAPNEDVLTASKAGDKAGVEAALTQGASVNAVDPLGPPGQTTPLGIAAAGGHANVAALLLDHGANVNGADGLGQSPLHMAAEHGSNEVAKLLLDRGANVDARDFLGATPLQYASLASARTSGGVPIVRPCWNGLRSTSSFHQVAHIEPRRNRFVRVVRRKDRCLIPSAVPIWDPEADLGCCFVWSALTVTHFTVI
jgi:hypothetical protein